MQTQFRNPFKIAFFKLMSSAVFGKTRDSIRKRCEQSILNDSKGYLTVRKLGLSISKPNYKEPKEITNSKINIFHFTKTKICYNKPIYI